MAVAADDTANDSVANDDTAAFKNAMKNSNTVRKTVSDMNILSKWMIKNNELRKPEEIPVIELYKILAKFFMNIKKDDGSPYEPTTVKSFQSSICRDLLEKCNFNILLDKEFHHSREVISAKLKELKSMGMGAKKRRADPFTVEEINTLYDKEFLGSGNPKSLIRTVWLNNSLHFGLRSREEHSTLKWGDLQMKVTSDGQQYLEHTERVTKTRNGSNRETRAFQAKMFADSGNPRCPIEAYKQYIKRRPHDMMENECPFYLGFARIIKDGVWFSRRPMGKNTLYNFVRVMCEEANIKGRKTNHSARKTTVTALVHENIPDTRIMQFSGHKNVQSINSYSSASLAQQKEMSNILSKVGTGQIIDKSTNKDINQNILPSTETSEMPDIDDAELMSAFQEAELQVALQDITNYENTNKSAQSFNEMPEIIHENHKGRPYQMFAGATITGNVTINFPA